MKSIKEYIEETNQQFLDATPEHKRVMIAEDVIFRIEKGMIIPREGNFWANRWSIIDDNKDTSVKDELNNDKVNCRVCAKGAIFCSLIGRVNKLGTHELGKMNFTVSSLKDEGHSKLLEFFSAEQIDLIETAFESTSFLSVVSLEERCKAQEFSYLSNDVPYQQISTHRMIRIMRNIIAHEGTFVPEADLSAEAIERIAIMKAEWDSAPKTVTLEPTDNEQLPAY